MTTLFQLGSRALIPSFQFSTNYLSNSTSRRLKEINTRIHAMGRSILDLIPSYITARAFQSSLENRVKLFWNTGNTTQLDFKGFDFANTSLEDIISSLKIIYNRTKPADNPLKILRLPDSIPFDEVQFTELISLCPNLEQLTIYKHFGKKRELLQFLQFAATVPHLQIEIRCSISPKLKGDWYKELLSNHVNLSIEWITRKDQLHEFDLLVDCPQLKKFQIQLFVTNHIELERINEHLSKHESVTCEINLYLRDLEEIQRCIFLLSTYTGYEIRSLTLNDIEINQSDFETLLSFRVKRLNLNGVPVKNIHSPYLKCLTCTNCPELTHVDVPNANDSVLMRICPELVSLNAPIANQIQLSHCPNVTKVVSVNAKKGVFSDCIKLAEIIFLDGSESLEITNCVALTNLHAPATSSVVLTNAPLLTSTTLPAAHTFVGENCGSLVSATLPLVRFIQFKGCENLEYLDAPSAKLERGYEGLWPLRKLKVLNIPSYTSFVSLRNHPQLQILNAQGSKGIVWVSEKNLTVRIQGPRYRCPNDFLYIAMIVVGVAVMFFAGVVSLTHNPSFSFSYAVLVVLNAMLFTAMGGLVTELLKRNVIPEITRIFPEYPT